MRSRPNAVELLEAAERTLSGEVAPDLTSRQRYNVALITSAMGIARRELTGGLSAWPDELDALQSLYGRERGKSPEAVLSRLNRRLAADFRTGVYDEKGRAQKHAFQLMREDVTARLAEDNPRYER